MNVINNSSVVCRLDAESQRILFLGDLGEEAGDFVLEHVPAQELHADFVQMAHHGQNGVKKNFYETVAPKACLWNTLQWLWDNNQSGKERMVEEVWEKRRDRGGRYCRHTVGITQWDLDCI